jgi:hypothetical protein
MASLRGRKLRRPKAKEFYKVVGSDYVQKTISLHRDLFEKAERLAATKGISFKFMLDKIMNQKLREMFNSYEN